MNGWRFGWLCCALLTCAANVYAQDASIPDAALVDAALTPDAAAIADAALLPDAAFIADAAPRADSAPRSDANVTGDCTPGCRDTGHLLVCVNGNDHLRSCGGDEVCRDGACVLRNVPDSGPDCVPGCNGATTVRRCSAGEAVDIACDAYELCRTGQCVPDGTGPEVADASVVTACAPRCVDALKLSACTSSGETLVVDCGEGNNCVQGECRTQGQFGPKEEPKSGCGFDVGQAAMGGFVVVWTIRRRQSGTCHKLL